MSIQMAKDGARRAAAKNNVREAEKEFPRLKAALLTANKEFGMPIPPSGRGAVNDLELGLRFLEVVLPLLHEGHIEEAKTEAEGFLKRFDA